jgi:hypothetical protein
MPHAEPSPEQLDVFAAVVRELDAAALAVMRDRMVALGEHPAAIEVIDRELRGR